MKSKRLADILQRVESWPADRQDELADIATDIEARLKLGDYAPTSAEQSGIERGLRAAVEGRFASDQQVEAALAKLRKA